MILPIVAYGSPVLREVCVPISSSYPALKELIANMFDTMYHSNGVGIAAPQVGLAIRLFVVDTAGFANDESYSESQRAELRAFKKVFINAKIEQQEGGLTKFNEGCLSIPGVHEEVYRPDVITISYLDEHFNPQTQKYSGLIARVIQHEYDHIEGILFTDKISTFKKRLIKKRLDNIQKGKINTRYPMRFSEQRK